MTKQLHEYTRGELVDEIARRDLASLPVVSIEDFFEHHISYDPKCDASPYAQPEQVKELALIGLKTLKESIPAKEHTTKSVSFDLSDHAPKSRKVCHPAVGDFTG